MTIDEYFGDWMRVIDRSELLRITAWLQKQNPNTLCPSHMNVFKAFTLCSYRNCKVVFIGQDPYPQKGVATGVLFGNNPNTPEDKLSPSLDIVKEAAINYEIPHYGLVFDNSLESWAEQGILMINSALTCKMNEIGSHSLTWRPFVSKLLKNMSYHDSGMIYVLFGRQAQSFKPYINAQYNDIIEIEHPAYFARTNTKMPYSVFTDINKLLKGRYNTQIEWYQELTTNNTEENGKEREIDCDGDDYFWSCPL